MPAMTAEAEIIRDAVSLACRTPVKHSPRPY
jgi:hypothetical protein